MVERFYEYEIIKKAVDCFSIAKDIGLDIKDNRCKAVWRGGDNDTSISFDPGGMGWHDFGTGKSGSVIDLVALVMFGGDIDQAQQWLGDKLGLEAAINLEKNHQVNRVGKLKADGYAITKIYPYKDEKGTLVHFKERWECPGKKKEFVQRAADGKYSIKAIKTILYRLNEWHGSPFVCLCEGEKDADTVVEVLGYPATTSTNGASHWEDYYNEWLRGKDIVIFWDNDQAGKNRLNQLLWDLRDVAGAMKAVGFASESEGFDVTDYFAKHGKEKLVALVNAAPDIDKAKIEKPCEDYQALEAAKTANKENFRNYIAQVNKESGEQVKHPRQINDLIKDVHTRFLAFPRKIGDSLFDHDRDTQRIEIIGSPNELTAWAARKSKKQVDFSVALPGAVTKQELFEGLRQSAQYYEAVSHVPDFPRRPDVYYAHPAIPRPHPNHKYFYDFVEFFNPADEDYKILLKAFFMAPLFYIFGVPHPLWIIDSEDGAGAGKTTLVEQCAALYNTEPIKTHKQELKNNYNEIMKRVVSSSGRMRRILLVDNVTGDFVCQEFADMVTARSLSGKAPYGRGEETRPNNLTYVITANSAAVDQDLASRAFYIYLKAAQYSSTWLTRVSQYIAQNRYRIIADQIDIMEQNEPFDTEPCTRFPEFETRVLMPCCGSFDEYNSVIKKMAQARQESNIDDENAAIFSDTIRSNLMELNIKASEACFIRSQVIDRWFQETAFRYDVKQMIRNFAKAGKMPEVDKKLKIWPNNGADRRNGVMWNRQDKDCPVNVIGMIGNKIGVVTK